MRYPRLAVCCLFLALCLDGVAAAATGVQVASSLNPAVAGQPVTFTATVTNVTPPANSTITFTVDGTAGTPVALINGIATSASMLLSTATHTVSASYSGDGTIGTLAGGQVVAQCPTSIVVGTSANPQLVFLPTVFSARISATVGIPTGSIDFQINGTNFLSVPLVNGLATASYSSAPGTYAVTAVYNGTPDFAPSIGALAENQQFVIGDTQTEVTSSLNPSLLGSLVQFTAVVTSDFGEVSGGSVQFAADGTNLGSAVTMTGDTAVSAPQMLLNGVHIVTATFISSGGFLQSVGTLAGNQVVNTLSTTTTITTSKSPASAFESVEFTATVSSAIGTPPGNVQFTINGTSVGSAISLSNGVATLILPGSGTALGNVAVTASYQPVSIFGASSGTLTQVYTPQPTTLTVTSSLNPSVTGQTITYFAQLAAGGIQPTGSVDFVIDGGAAINVPVNSSSGIASITPPAFSTAGIHSIDATYNPPAIPISACAGSLPGGQQVNAASLSTTLAAAINPGLVGQSLSYIATVNSPNVSPTGTVQFSIDGMNLGAAATLSNGQAVSPQIATLSVGSHNVVAFYSGNAGTSTSAPVVQVLTQALTSIAVTTNNNPANLGDTITFTATVTPQPAGTPTGSVTLYNGSSALGMFALGAGGTVTLTTPPLPTAAINAGNLPITAVYSGDANYLGSTSPVMLQTVLKGTTVLAWASPADIHFPQALSGTQLNATANVAGTFVYTPASATVLQPGSNQPLTVQFVPDDGVNYSPAFKTVTINILPAIITYTSLPQATPNPAFTNSLVRFSAAVVSLAPLTLTWDFGDGSIDATNSSNVTHKYVAPGTYSAVLTVKDSTGQIVTQPLQVVVNDPQPAAGGELDSDGDGFPDALETLLNTDPFDNLSKPAALSTQVLPATKVKITLNFAKPGTRNSLVVSGTLPGAATPGQQISIDVSGVTRTFQLNGSGVGTQGKDNFYFNSQTNQFAMKLSNGAFEKPLAAAGLTGTASVTKSPRTLSITILSNQVLLKSTKDVLYTCKAGKTGVAQ